MELQTHHAEIIGFQPSFTVESSINTNKKPFVEANTEEVSLSFLKKQMYCAKLFKRWRSNYIPSRIY